MASPIRILLIEENIIIQAISKSLLLDFDCEMEAVDNFQSLKEHLKESQYDAILWDMDFEAYTTTNQQVLSTIEALRCNTTQLNYKVPIFSFSTDFEPAYFETSNALGVKDYFYGPVSKNKINHVVNHLKHYTL